MQANPTFHPSPEQLAAYALGKLDDAEAAAVVEHLETCPACQQTVEESPSDTFLNALQAARPGAETMVPPELANHPRFRIVRELGRGGMGVVYLAEHRLMERQVAIKVLDRSLVDNPARLERCRREVRAASKLDHPNIVRAFDAERAGDLHLLIMEYIDGLSLAELVERRGPLAVAESSHYIRQAALALQHAYENGMVHRDLKPQNVMLLPENGLIKVLDFGLAKLGSERQAGKGLTAVNTVMGTPEYMAPEQANDAGQTDIRADIYSLGCTLYYLLAGRPPFVAPTPMQTILAHMKKDAAPLHAMRSDVSVELSSIVGKMVSKDPARRYPIPRDVAEALAPFGQPGQTAAKATTPLEWLRTPEWSAAVLEEGSRTPDSAPRGRKWQNRSLAALAVFLLLVMAILTIPLTSNKQPGKQKVAKLVRELGHMVAATKTCKRFFFPNADHQDLPAGRVSLDEFGEENGLIMAWCAKNSPQDVEPLRRVWILFVRHPGFVKRLAEGTRCIPVLGSSTAGLVGSSGGQGPLLAIGALFRGRLVLPPPDDLLLAIGEADDVYNRITKQFEEAQKRTRAR
jgi:serine/threonine protein kinase